MEQKFIVLVYYKGFAPMEQDIPAGQNRIKFSVALMFLYQQAQKTLPVAHCYNPRFDILSERPKYFLYVFCFPATSRALSIG
jgi:hypothetical protein